VNDLDDAMARIWDRSRPLTRERLAKVEAAVALITRGRCPAGTLEEAQHAAHQLAGSLGTFGLQDGTLLARQIETELKEGRDPDRLTSLTGRLRALLEPRLGAAGD
jgi:HPt (histidine-containing phosphotransfer) domain-containing protein